MPHTLVEAFSATLEETVLADLLLHIIDVSNEQYEQQIEQVNQVLASIHADNIPQLLIYNKSDLLPAGFASKTPLRDLNHTISALYLSAQTGEGLENLRQALIEYFPTPENKT